MSARERLALDAVILAAVLGAANPAVTGMQLHEWLGVVFTVPALIHLIVNWEWVVRTLSRLAEKLRTLSALNLMIDSGLFLSLVGVTVSGLLVVPGLAASMGLEASGVWHAAHLWTSDLTIAFTLAHVVTHSKWIADVVRRLFLVPSVPSPITRTGMPATQPIVVTPPPVSATRR